MTLNELSTVAGLELTCELHPWGWAARFKECEVKDQPDDGVLAGMYGEGPTPEAALDDYAQQLHGKILVHKAMSDQRREFRIPDTLTA
jgi:hypothetical protein